MTEEINPIVYEYVQKSIENIRGQSNHIRKDFFKRYNEIVTLVGYECFKKGEMKEDVLKEWIIGKHLLSDVAVKRYIKMLILKKTYDYDEKSKTFRLPQHIRYRLAETKPTTEASVEDDR